MAALLHVFALTTLSWSPQLLPAPSAIEALLRPFHDSTSDTFPAPSSAMAIDVDLADAAPEPGQPASLHARLEAAGYSVASHLTADVSWVPVQGSASRAVPRGLIDVSLAMDLEKISGMRGASGFVQYRWREGPNGSALLADAQGFSNIDAASFRGLGEAWFEQRLADGRLRVKAGRVDGNSEFAGVEAARSFLNSSMGVSPTVAEIPTYPDAAPSINVATVIHPRVEVSAGLYGSMPDAARWQRPFTIAQVRHTWAVTSDSLDGRVLFGGWRQRVSDDGTAGSNGLYAVAEQTLSKSVSATAARDVVAFMQWGHSGSETLATDRHVGGGVVWRTSAEDAESRTVGIGATRVRFGSAAEFPRGNELAVAAFARLQVLPWLALTPDLQVVRHPNGNRAAGTSAVATVRFQLSY